MESRLSTIHGAIRGTGSGASIAVGRVGSIVGPLLAGLMMGGGTSATGVVHYMIPVAAIAAVAVFALSFRPASGGHEARVASH